MEKPYEGRATITDNYGTVDVVIPVKRQLFVTLFLGFWLCGWLVGEVFVLTMLLGGFSLGGDGMFVSLFMAVWLTGWTVGGLFALRAFFWLLLGKEIITIGQGRMTINKKGLLFKKPKTYDMNDVKGMRVEAPASLGYNYGSRNSLNNTFAGGTIRFDYGMKTVKFAGGIDEAEAKHIVKELKRKGYLFDRNIEGDASGHFY